MLSMVFLLFGLIVILLTVLVLIVLWQWKQVKDTIPQNNSMEKKRLKRIYPSELTLLRVIREVVRKGDISFLDEITELAYNKARLQSSEQAINKALDDDTENF